MLRIPPTEVPRPPAHRNGTGSDEQLEAAEITDPESLEFNSVPFACGHYADVHTGYWRPPGQKNKIKVAIKVMRLAGQSQAKTQEYAQSLIRVDKRLGREMYVWQRLDHPRITKLLGFMKTSNTIIPGDRACLISPFKKSGDLQTYLEHHPDVDRMALLLQAADGLNYLHTFQPKPIAHLDIKPQNILVDDNGEASTIQTSAGVPLTMSGQVELCDFGISKMLDDVSTGFTTSGNTSKGTMPYMSPEVLDSDGSGGNTASDVYAFGCLILQTLSGQAPFYKIKSKGQMVMKLAQGKTAERNDHPIDAPPEAVDRLWVLLNKCWQLDPRKRPAMAEVIVDLHVIQGLVQG